MEKEDYTTIKDPGSPIFRWTMLVLVTLAAKVLNKQELMNIYSIVGKTSGHSSAVDGLHSQVIQLMKHGEKNEKHEVQ